MLRQFQYSSVNANIANIANIEMSSSTESTKQNQKSENLPGFYKNPELCEQIFP